LLTARETGRFRRQAQDALQKVDDAPTVLRPAWHARGVAGTHGRSEAHAKSMTIGGLEAYTSFAASAVAGTENRT
jgi:hypothetical protein